MAQHPWRRVGYAASRQTVTVAGGDVTMNFQLTAAIRHANMVGHCFSYHATRIETATSLYSWRNFAERRDELLAGYPGVRSLAEMAKAASAS